VRPPRSAKPAKENPSAAGLLLFIASNWHMAALPDGIGTRPQ
jgi:hypothetical protein